LAVSASSPFWQGIDTGLASCRTALYRTLPHAGVPRYFPRWKNFRSYFRVMRECGAIQSMKDIYWDIRPRPEFGTIELRVCDMPATLETTFALVALVRSLAIASQRLLEERPQLRKGDIRRHWIAVENKWLATRYGLDAIYIRTPAGKRRPLRQDLQELLNRLMPIAAETGDDVYLSTLLPLDKFESNADRQRRLYRESGKARPLVDDMIARLASELDEVPANATGSSGGASSGANGAALADSPDASPLDRPQGITPPKPGGPNVDRTNVDQRPAERITIDQPAATPRASSPPTAGTLNRSAALNLPGSVLFRSPAANTGPAADRQLALAVRG
jgi:Glutamate-cysteine ligase family 2(GCS2)